MMNFNNVTNLLGLSLDLNSLQTVSMLLMAVIVLMLLQIVVFSVLLARVAKRSRQTVVEVKREEPVATEPAKSVEDNASDTLPAPAQEAQPVEEVKTIAPVQELPEEATAEEVEPQEAVEAEEEEAAASVAEAYEEDVFEEEEPEIEEIESYEIEEELGEVEEEYSYEEDEDEDDDSEDEEEDEEEDEDEEDEVEEVVVSGEKSLRPRVTYPTRLKLSSDKIKGFYSEIKNEFMSYGIKSRISKTKENFNISRDNVARFVMRGKTLKLYIALDPTSLDNKYYHHKDVSAKKTYADIPTLISIKSARAVSKIKELIEMLAQNLELRKKPRYKTKDFSADLSAQGLTYTDRKGYAHLVRASVLAEDATVYPDELADVLTQVAKVDSKTARFVKTAVTVKDLANMFADGDTVSIERVKALGVGSKNANWLSVQEGESIDKKLKVYAREFTPDAAKMIVLAGGEVFRIENK